MILNQNINSEIVLTNGFTDTSEMSHCVDNKGETSVREADYSIFMCPFIVFVGTL